MGYRMMSKFFLKMLCLLVFNQKNISCLPVVRKTQEKNSEYRGSQIWEAEDKIELRLVTQDKEGRLGQVLRSGLCVPASGLRERGAQPGAVEQGRRVSGEPGRRGAAGGIQAASEENLQQFQEEHIASIRSHMELRIKDLGSELAKMKTFRDSNKAELEKYKQHYLEELKVRKSLEKKRDKTNERLAEISTKLEVEKQQDRSFLGTHSSTPVLAPSSVGNFSPTSGFNANLISRANVGFSTSIPHRSNDSVETYLTKMWRELDRSITRELRKGAAEFVSEFSIISPLYYLQADQIYIRTYL